MNSKTDVRLTSSQRLGRGLKYSAVGPVDVTRGTVELSLQAAQSAAGRIRRRLDKSRLAKEFGDAQDTIAQELAAVQGVVAMLPQALVLAGGAVAFTIVRRSMQPEPSPLPPSVDVAPKP